MIPFNPIHYFSLGPLKFYTHGMMLATGLAVAFYLAYRNAKKYKIDEKRLLDSFFYVVVGVLAGARLFYFVLYYYQFNSLIEFFYIWEGGLVSYGGIVGGGIAFYLFSKKHRLNFWKHADLFAPYLALGGAITRIGCFLNWDDYGKYTTIPWGVSADGDFPRHPTQIYHVLADLLIFLYLYSIKDKKRFDGQVFLSGLMLYAAGRFIVDIFRDYSQQLWFFSPSQLFSIAVFISAFAVYMHKRKRHAKEE